MRAFASLTALALSFGLLSAAAPLFAAPQAAEQSPAGAATEPVEIPPPPSVDDPMLAPMAPPARTLRTWNEALAILRARSTELRIALNDVRRAEAQTRTALAAVLPTVNATGIATHHFLTNDAPVFNVREIAGGRAAEPRVVPQPTPNILQGNITLSQPIVALAPWHRIGTAERNEEVARLSLEDQKRLLAINVAAAIVGVVTAERVAELNRVGLRNALERLSLTVLRRDLGGATGVDVVRAQQDVEAARATLVTGDESLRQAREALGLALGVPEQFGVSRDVKLDALEADARTVCHPLQAIEERADLAAARQRIEVAERNVDNVYLQFAPTISAQSQLSTTTLVQGSFPNTLWNIQGVLSWNLWDGGARYGALRDNRAIASSAAESLEALRRQTTIQLEQARRAVRVAEDSLRVADAARALAAELDRLTRVGYQEGRGTSLELVVAAAALRQADINLALREFDVVRARILAMLALASCPW
jgi:outer membrane protein TolC